MSYGRIQFTGARALGDARLGDGQGETSVREGRPQAGRENQVKPKRVATAVTAGVEAYCRYMRRYATMPELDIWYDGMRVYMRPTLSRAAIRATASG